MNQPHTLLKRAIDKLFQHSERLVNVLGTGLPEPRILLDFLGFERPVKQIRQKRSADTKFHFNQMQQIHHWKINWAQGSPSTTVKNR